MNDPYVAVPQIAGLLLAGMRPRDASCSVQDLRRWLEDADFRRKAITQIETAWTAMEAGELEAVMIPGVVGDGGQPPVAELDQVRADWAMTTAALLIAMPEHARDELDRHMSADHHEAVSAALLELGRTHGPGRGVAAVLAGIVHQVVGALHAELAREDA